MEPQVRVLGSLQGGILHLSTDGGSSNTLRAQPLLKVFSGGVAVNFGDDGVFKGVGLVSSVPGPQTVPRAEAFAPIITLQALNLPPAAAWDTDASYVPKNANHLPFEEELGSQSVFAGLHEDIWHAIKSLIDDSRLPLPQQVPSHVEFSESGVSF